MGIKILLPAALAALAWPIFAQPHAAADLGHAITGAGLDVNECYQVRDLRISKEDATFYLTDGYLMFGKPVNGAPLTAVFSAETEGGDAEVLLLPPDRSERKSMATYTGTPNLDEHFTQAVFVFTDDTARSLLDQIHENGAKKAPDMGTIVLTRWGGVIANLMSGFESRIALDLLTPGARRGGFFQAVMQGKKLGNFDILYDARQYEQLVAGQMTTRNGVSWWDTWASFPSQQYDE